MVPISNYYTFIEENYKNDIFVGVIIYNLSSKLKS